MFSVYTKKIVLHKKANPDSDLAGIRTANSMDAKTC